MAAFPVKPSLDMGSQKHLAKSAGSVKSFQKASDERRAFLTATALARRPDPAGARVSVSPTPLEVAKRRQRVIQEISRLRKTHTQAKAVRTVGVSATTIWRWKKKFSAKGFAGLFPNNFKSGRRSPFKEIRLTAAAVRELESLIVQQGSPRAAWRQFASSPFCPPNVVRRLQRGGSVPASLSGIVRLQQVQGRIFASAGSGRVYVNLLGRGVLHARLVVPAGFKILEVHS
jgi:hypothetical protein